jgi:hypothetical protein
MSQDQQGRRSRVMTHKVRTSGAQWPQRFSKETVSGRTVESQLREQVLRRVRDREIDEKTIREV